MKLTTIALLAATIATGCGSISDDSEPASSGIHSVMVATSQEPFLVGAIGDTSFDGPASLDLDRFDDQIVSARVVIKQDSMIGYFIMADVSDLASFSPGRHVISHPAQDTDT